MMDDVLNMAEARGQTAQGDRQAFEATAVAAMRAEIGGPALYEEARRQLPIMEQAFAEARAWLERLARIERKSGASLRIFHDILQSISKLCDAGTHEIRRGLAAYEQLSFGDVAWAKDPRQVDLTKRAILISQIRQDLRNFDGKVSFLNSQRSRVESAIRESGWPHFSGTPATPVTVAPEVPSPPDIRVEMGGGPVPPSLR